MEIICPAVFTVMNMPASHSTLLKYLRMPRDTEAKEIERWLKKSIVQEKGLFNIHLVVGCMLQGLL